MRKKSVSNSCMICIALTAFLIPSCSRVDPPVEAEEIRIDNGAVNPLAKIDTLTDTIKIVALETGPHCFIRDYADRIILTDNRIIIANVHDDDKITLFELSSGKFISQLKPSGEGPGEYAYAHSVAYNSFSNEIEVFSDFQRKTLIFDCNGNFKREEPEHLLYSSKQYLSPSTCVYSCIINNSELMGQDTSYRIIIHDKLNQKWSSYYPFSANEEKMLPYLLLSNFQYHKGDLVWFEAFNPKILTVTAEKIQPRYTLKFLKNPLPEDFVETNTEYRFVYDAAIKENFPFLCFSYFENDHFVAFPYKYNGILHFFAYDKRIKQPLLEATMIGYYKWRLLLPIPVHVYDGGFVYVIGASDFISLFDSHEDKSLLPQPFHDIRNKIKPEDNPVILTVKLK